MVAYPLKVESKKRPSKLISNKHHVLQNLFFELFITFFVGTLFLLDIKCSTEEVLPGWDHISIFTILQLITGDKWNVLILCSSLRGRHKLNA